ncbi:hypothetical protein DL765_004607 [Monosporascus sp. GIB2]|nr:hypothetical protein DL765_004607 [Monosporascus sp. GIB2]
MEPVPEFDAVARSLIQRAIGRFDEKYGFGSMSCAVYDTAWVSLVTKVVNGEKQWLFPESFQNILEAQSEDGGWDTVASQVDGILNTAASLLTLIRHAKDPLQIDIISQDELQKRSTSAAVSLQCQLAVWDVSAATHVGFEIIVPALLKQLELEGFTFNFDGRDELYKLNAEKLAGFNPEYLYRKTQMTALHSLEAFIGVIDFDRVAHHKALGSMMASPSSTAAYLMNTTSWDNEAEAYLRHVVNVSPTHDGGVPSAYPSTYFEYTWILSTLLRAGFSYSDLESRELREMIKIITQAFEQGNGVIGFGNIPLAGFMRIVANGRPAPSLGSDVDDTAKGIMLLNMLQPSNSVVVEPDQMIRMFGADTHFRTYAAERDPSYSANCNVLLSLIHYAIPFKFSKEIQAIVQFLCERWWTADGTIKDKWNTCHLYPSLLLAEAFTDLLSLVDGDDTPRLLTDDLRARVSITLFQACLRTLLQQLDDGSWGNSMEQTSYGILILSEARRLSFFDDIRQQVDSAIDAGVLFIQTAHKRPLPHDYLWIEKVSYRSPFITEAYVLAALRAASCPLTPANVGSSFWVNVTAEKVAHLKLFRATPLFSGTPEWQLRASLIEAALFQPLLRAQRLKTFPRNDMETDRYFEIIPFTWTACNNRLLTFASTSLIYEMMIISFLNYQADEFMEAVAGPEFRENFSGLRELIDNVFSSENNDTSLSKHDRVYAPLSRFVAHVLEHPAVLAADKWDRVNVKRQLRIFIHAHVTQNEDNSRFAGQKSKETYCSPSDTFFRWVRTTSADHTSCPYSFSFISCLISSSLSPGAACFPTAAQKYLSEAVCRHLASMCRMYNDYGSIMRDQLEGNLNSINFPEFQTVKAMPINGAMQSRKDTLFKLAEYERNGLNDALERLANEAELVGASSTVTKLEKRKMVIWRMFVDVTDLYGQIYVVRDIASRMKFAGSSSLTKGVNCTNTTSRDGVEGREVTAVS